MNEAGEKVTEGQRNAAKKEERARKQAELKRMYLGYGFSEKDFEQNVDLNTGHFNLMRINYETLQAMIVIQKETVERLVKKTGDCNWKVLTCCTCRCDYNSVYETMSDGFCQLCANKFLAE